MFEDCFPFYQAMQGDSASGLNLDLQVSHKAVNILLQRIKKALYYDIRMLWHGDR